MELESIPLVLMLLVMGASFHFAPRLTRPDLFFGVTVDRDYPQSNEGRQLLRRYRAGMWSATVASIVGAVATARPLVTIVIMLLGTGVSFAAARRVALKHRIVPSTAVEADLALPAERLPGGALLVLLPFALLVLLGLWALSPMHSLSGQLVIHWGAIGPDHRVLATPHAIILRLVRAAFVCVVFAGAALGVLYGSRRISAGGPAAARERQFRRRMVQFLIVCEYFMVVLAAITVTQAPGVIVLCVSIVFAMILTIFVVRIIRLGQGGSRSAAPGTLPVGDRLSDEHWIWGIFYFNREDRAVFVEARTGIGYTLNFGNIWSWVLLAVIVATPRVLRYL